MITKTVLLTISLLILCTIPSYAETYTLDKDSWTCQGYGAIQDIEQLAKIMDENEKAGIRYDDSKFQHLANTAHCMFSATTQGSKDDTLVNKPINIMYVAGQYAFVCSKITLCRQQMPMFDCTNALISDVRDSHGRPVTAQQLEKEASGKTMADVKEFFPRSCN